MQREQLTGTALLLQRRRAQRRMVQHEPARCPRLVDAGAPLRVASQEEAAAQVRQRQ